MTETARERAQREAEQSIRFAHLAIDLLSYVVADMRKAAILRPDTRSKMQDAVREMERLQVNGARGLDRLKRHLTSSELLDEEQKRERPGRS
jgi:hypothetical protein